MTLGEGDKHEVSIAYVVASQLVARKFGALNYVMVCNAHQLSVFP